VFETLLGAEDAVISDELNHASIIDGIRLCKARRSATERRPRRPGGPPARGRRRRPVQTDRHRRRLFDGRHHRPPARDLRPGRPLRRAGDGGRQPRRGLCRRDRPRHAGTLRGHAGRIDLLTGTLGKALGGASGGYVSGRRELIDLLRQRSRPYLFSNTLAPVIAGASIAALDLLAGSTALRDRLAENTRHFRTGLAATGLTLRPGSHPIVPVMLGDAALAQRFAARLLDHGVYAVGFFHPVVPHGQARIRTQVSAAHRPEDLEFAIRAFATVKHELSL
jgi:glycine C-acetyltransferase